MATTDQPPETLSEVQHRERSVVDGGELVYDVETEYRSHPDREVSVARRLVGFANVTDWDGIRSALIKRGHGVGAIHHLPVFEEGHVGERAAEDAVKEAREWLRHNTNVSDRLCLLGEGIAQ